MRSQNRRPDPGGAWPGQPRSGWDAGPQELGGEEGVGAQTALGAGKDVRAQPLFCPESTGPQGLM